MYLRFPEDLTSMHQEILVLLDRAGGETEARAADSIVIGGVGAECTIENDLVGGVTVAVSGNFTLCPGMTPAETSPARLLTQLYRDRGEDALAAVDGAFMCVLIDWRKNSIVCAIDKIGIARAYVGTHGCTVVCSDSLRELKSALPSGLELDLDSVNEFLILGWLPSPNSMFRQVKKLPPATLHRWHDGANCSTEYWDIRHSSDFVRRSPQDLTDEIRAHLDRAVERGVARGGRWGSFLSGGMDSSSVVSSLALATDAGFPTYFGAFDPDLNKYLTIPDEAPLAQIVADHCHSSHQIVSLESNAVEGMPEVVEALEEPVCDSGCLVVAQILKKAREEGVDGVMTGVGGDFLFGGERRHILINLLRYMRRLPRPTWSAVRWMFGLLPLLRSARLSQLHFDYNRLYTLMDLEFDRMYARILESTPVPMDRLLSPDLRSSLQRSPVDGIREYLRRTPHLDPLSQLLYLDLKMVTPNHCVREVQTLGRHFGVATYNPYLDAEFVDFSMTIPAGDKVRGLELKASMKKAMRGRLPDSIMSRRKGGLGGPTRWWVTHETGLLKEVLSRESIERRGLFDYAVVEECKELTVSDREDYSKLLWSLFTLELWMRNFIDEA